ncbi:MAG: hypothetical protein EORIYHIE_002964 [Candidatus Fervidibacter sp.]
MKAGRAEVKTKRGVLRADAEKWLEVADLILRSKRASRLANGKQHNSREAEIFVARVKEVLRWLKKQPQS